MENEVHAKRLLWASFFTIFAAGVGFAVRGGILGDWSREFGFTMTELGGITGGGLVGFGFVIIIFSLFLDQVGFGKPMLVAFLMHFLSAVITLAAGPVYHKFGKDACYWCLYIGMFMFSVGNGICEAVVNPLIATLFSKEKTHYLNILHASWPAGLVSGALACTLLSGRASWELQMSLFLVPTVLYGVMMLGQKFPMSEAKAAGAKFGEMVLQFASPVLIVLLCLHALVGYVELGTDSWISKITGSIMADPQKGLMLFIYTSALMFALRFVAGPIVHKISPLGLLCVSGVLGAVGLTLLGGAETIVACVIAATVYACGKTFLWPTMLAVASERFPKGGALVMGAMGGVGMLSAGFLGGPGIGYKQDYYASQNLKEKLPAAYDRYKADKQNSFLVFPAIAGLDGSKVGVVEFKGPDVDKKMEEFKKAEKDEVAIKAEASRLQSESAAADLKNTSKVLKDGGKNADSVDKLITWWDDASKTASEDRPAVSAAGLFGGKMALKWTAIVPAVMAVLYLLLILYFKATGGYKAVEIAAEGSEASKGEESA